jgi:hypothetical protein
LVVTKPRTGARPAERHRPGLGGLGVAGQGQGPARATGAALAGVGSGTTRAAPTGAGRCGPGQGVAGAAARRDLVAAAVRVEAMREREKRKKERVDPGTIPAYVRRDDTSVDDHKWVDLRGGHDALCSSATR